MNESEMGAYIVLGGLGLLFAAAMGFNLYWVISNELIWRSRVRRLLEQEGFTVRHMERRWLTRGPFPDLKPPGMKFHKEWLVRVDAVDRERRPRAGWLRWRRRRPWEASERWAVHWDEAPSTGQGNFAGRVKGLSTVLFFPMIATITAGTMAALLAMGRHHIAAITASLAALLAPGPHNGRVSTPPPAVPAPGVYEIRCRGGGRDSFQIVSLAAGDRSEPDQVVPVVLMSLRFTPGEGAAGGDSAGLGPGTCAWLDRPLNELEPREIRFEAPGVRSMEPPHVIVPAPGTFPDAEFLRDPARYWSFFAFNFNAEYLLATDHRSWTAPDGRLE